MRRAGGQMWRSVGRVLSQHRPSPVITQPSISCQSSPKLVPFLPDNLRQHSNSSVLGLANGVDDSKGIDTLQNIRQRQAVLSASQQRRGFLSVGDGDEEADLSRHYEESLIIGYSPEQLYAVVAAVDLYEDFLPWCQKSSVIWCKDNEALEAELEIGFKCFAERYISHVELKKPHLIKTSVSQSSLFHHLTNVWEFKPGPTPHSTNLHFLVDFQFRSPLYRKVANMFFNEVVQQLVGSFESRCRTVYGPSLKVKEPKQEIHTHIHNLQPSTRTK
ncbi:unnamed protein product [Calypogeia fissa]